MNSIAIPCITLSLALFACGGASDITPAPDAGTLAPLNDDACKTAPDFGCVACCEANHPQWQAVMHAALESCLDDGGTECQSTTMQACARYDGIDPDGDCLAYASCLQAVCGEAFP